MSLATKYRPKKFNEVVGQNNVIEILIGETLDHNIKPSYLFVGKSGAGKTTTARILANEIGGNIVEIDAASYNSAESMRSLIASVKTRPIMHDYTVVIIDEVHTLSQVATQVLLKILEEPPEHLIFILCTTESDKIPQTIYNRCEVFEFVSIDKYEIQDVLRIICTKEHFEHDNEALGIIAQMADGSLRQAITYLEQCSTKPITIENVRQTLLADSFDTCMNLVYAVSDKDIEMIVNTIKNISNIDKFVEQFFTFLLDINVYILTKQRKLLSIPDVYADDCDKFSATDKKIIDKMLKVMLKLQYEGRNSPILKQLLIATLLEVSHE